MGFKERKENYKKARKEIGRQKSIRVQDKKEKEKIKNLILSTIPQGSFISISKVLLHSIGVNASLFLSDLLWKEKYFQGKGKLDGDGYFFNTEDDRMLSTSLSRKQQRKVIHLLESKDLIKTKKKGTPPKIFFKINHSAIADIMLHAESFQLLPKGTIECSQKEHILSINKLSTSPNGEVSACQKQAIDSLFSDRRKKQIIEKKKKYKKAYKLIKYWNSFPNVRRHNEESSKVYEETARALTMLMEGSLFKKNSLRTDFITKCSINQSFLKKKWVSNRIRKTMDRLSDYHKPGYWPGVNPNGDSLREKKIPLLRLLYNADRGTSIFLWVASVAPEAVGNKTKNLYPKLVDKYKRILESNTRRQETVLIRNVNAIVKYQRRIVKSVSSLYGHSSFGTWFGTESDPEPFINTHTNWLKNKYSGMEGKLPIKFIDTESTSFRNFVSDMKIKRNFILEPSAKERRMLEGTIDGVRKVSVNRANREKKKIEDEIL